MPALDTMARDAYNFSVAYKSSIDNLKTGYQVVPAGSDLQAAIDRGGIVQLLPGDYSFGGLVFSSPCILKGAGMGDTTLTLSGASIGLNLRSSYVTICDLELTGGSSYGILLQKTSSGNLIRMLNLERLMIHGFGDDNIRVSGPVYSLKIDSVWSYESTACGIRLIQETIGATTYTPNGNVLVNCLTETNGADGVRAQVSGLSVWGLVSEGNTGWGFDGNEGNGIALDARYVETNTAGQVRLSTASGSRSFSFGRVNDDNPGFDFYQQVNNTLQPACSLYMSAAQTIGDSSLTAIGFDVEAKDTVALHDTATNNSRITIPAGMGGRYLLTAGVRFAADADGYRHVAIRKGGTTELRSMDVPSIGAAVMNVNVSVIDENAAATDYYEVVVWHNAGGNLDIIQGANVTTFDCEKLG